MLCFGLNTAVKAAGKRFKRLASSAKYKKVLDNKLKRIRYFKDEIVVRFKKGTRKSVMKRYMLTNNLSVKKKISPYAYTCHAQGYDQDAAGAAIAIVENEGMKPSDYEDEELRASLMSVDLDEYRQLKTGAQKYRRNKARKKKKSRSSSEELVDEQWYLNNNGKNGRKSGADINIASAWELSKGAGVKVAVIDTGFDMEHPDINYSGLSYDVVDGDGDPTAPTKSKENHGTAVAGIIAAKDDGKGVVGVAPEAEIIPIRLISNDGMVSVSQIMTAHRKAVELGATIINNSWGSYDPALAKGEQLKISSAEEAMYKELATEANDGKGIVIIFAAGNSGANNFDNAPEARNEYTLSVGATDSGDKRASYSVYGEELDVVAPGGGSIAMMTTDREDVVIKTAKKKKQYVLGYSKGSYTKSFKGTSAAAPVVAGIAALIWSINPDLSADEVKQILKQSSRKDVDESFSAASFDEKHPELGWGRVDAGSAIDMALSY